MDTDRSTLLCKSNDVSLDFLAGRHHQVRHFVYHDDDERQMVWDQVRVVVIFRFKPFEQFLSSKLIVVG